MLGAFREPDAAQRVLSLFLTVLAVWLCARLQALSLRLRAREETSRWASSLRDLANLVAMVALLGAFLVAGLPTWGAVVASTSVVVALELARQLASTHAGAQRVAMLVGSLLAVPVVLWPAQVTGALDAVARSLFAG